MPGYVTFTRTPGVFLHVARSLVPVSVVLLVCSVVVLFGGAAAAPIFCFAPIIFPPDLFLS